jgi:uncharacterized membrane protein YidH (DUF202 family)
MQDPDTQDGPPVPAHQPEAHPPEAHHPEANHPEANHPEARGLARERTVLAWNRSGLAAVVCIAVLLRHLWPIEGDGELVATAAIAAAAIVWAVGLFSLTASTAGLREENLVGEKVFRLMTIGTVLLAVGGFVLAFFAPA